MLINLMCLITLLNFSMCLSLYMEYMGVMVYMDCTLINFMHFSVHPEQPLVHADQLYVPHNPLELLHVPVLVHVVHGNHGVHGMHPDQLRALKVHPEQPPVHADQFDEPQEPLELLHVPVLVHVVHGGHGVHGLHSDHFYALFSASRTTSCLC
jgi:hypothetical protein